MPSRAAAQDHWSTRTNVLVSTHSISGSYCGCGKAMIPEPAMSVSPFSADGPKSRIPLPAAGHEP